MGTFKESNTFGASITYDNLSYFWIWSVLSEVILVLSKNKNCQFFLFLLAFLFEWLKAVLCCVRMTRNIIF